MRISSYPSKYHSTSCLHRRYDCAGIDCTVFVESLLLKEVFEFHFARDLNFLVHFSSIGFKIGYYLELRSEIFHLGFIEILNSPKVIWKGFD